MDNYRTHYRKKPDRQQRDHADIYFGRNSFEHLWVGPHIPPTSDPTGAKTEELKRAFREHNLLREVIDNWKDGLIAKPFAITIRSNGQPVENEKAMKLLNAWVDKVNQQAIQLDPESSEFKQADPWQEFVLSLGVLGCGTLRLWQHNDELCLHVPRPGTTTVKYDDYSFIESISYQAGQVTETHRLDGDRMAVSTTTGGELIEDIYDTDGHWFIQQMHGETLLSDSAISKQQGLCHTLTMLMRNQEHAGFKRRTLLNAELPDEAYEVGPGIDEYLPGIPEQQIDGTMRYTTPSVHESQPFPVANFETSLDIWAKLLYREFRQTHMMDTGGAGLSGESRIQMRASMLVFLERWARRIESAFANVLTLVLRLNGYSNFDVVVDLNLSTGVMSAEERNALITEYQAGLLSLKTAIALLDSVSDPTAEVEALAEELQRDVEPPEYPAR